MYWDPFTFSDGRWYQWSLAGAEIAVCRTGRFWQAYCRPLPWNERGSACGVQEVPGFPWNGADESARAMPLLDAAVWDGDSAALRPCLPEKPFLLNLGGLTVLPGADTALELELPPAFRLVPANGEDGTVSAAREDSPTAVIFGFTPFELKETWYGRNTMEGTLCSSLTVNVPACLPAQQAAPSETDSSLCARGRSQAVIHCGMTIRNRAKTVVRPGKVPLYADGLAVYGMGGKLQSDAAVIETSGNDFRQTSQPPETEQGILLAPPGGKNSDGLIRQGTQIIKNLAGL